jgi:hypothetical protein
MSQPGGYGPPGYKDLKFRSKDATTTSSKSSNINTSASFAEKQVTRFRNALTLLANSRLKNFAISRSQNREQVAH